MLALFGGLQTLRIAKSQLARAAYRKRLKPPRNKGTPHVSSPRPQSRVEALWRTLLLDHCFGESPAPLETGFALGGFVALILHLTLPEEDESDEADEITANTIDEESDAKEWARIRAKHNGEDGAEAEKATA